jgi:hypothetical protein
MLGQRAPIEHYDIGIWHQVMHLNLNVPFILTQVLMPMLRKARDASVVFTSSGVGRHGRAYWGAYAVSKFGIEGLAQTLADELKTEAKIRVNCINPGATRTRMRAAAYPGEDPNSRPDPASLMAPYLWLLGPASRSNGASVGVRPRYSRSGVQGREFLVLQHAVTPLPQGARQLNRPVAHPDKPAHPAFHGLPDATNQAISALTDDHPKPPIRTGAARRLHAVKAGLAVLKQHAVPDSRQRCLGHSSLHAHRVFPLELARRVHQGVGKLAIRGQQEQARG